jgi:hypothetical protein
MTKPETFKHEPTEQQESTMKSQALQELDHLIGEWTMTMTDAWFLESPDVKVEASATIEWLGDAFLQLRADFGTDHGSWHWVIGRNDAREQYVLLYHDERGVLRVFDMTFADGQWTLTREDPDFHQRFVATVERDRIDGRWEASEDAGATWRKDFDLIFERAG